MRTSINDPTNFRRRCAVIGSLCLLLASGLFGSADTDDATKKEQARFEGTWSFALVEVDGAKMPVPSFENNKLIISKNGTYVVAQGKTITRGVMKLDPSKTPKEYDVTITDGPAKGKTFSAIYELDGDTYKWCGSFLGKERPTTLETKPGSGLIFQILKREKQDVKEALIDVARKELTGTWQALTYALNGNKAPEEDLKTTKLTIDADGKAAARRDGQIFIGGMMTIDPTTIPMAIDVAYTDGNFKGQTSLAIAKIDDDVLTFCRSLPGQPRPTGFSSEPGSGHTLMTYKREKEAAK
jgi:uncharacterized protein (TIGR03067 family)